MGNRSCSWRINCHCGCHSRIHRNATCLNFSMLSVSRHCNRCCRFCEDLMGRCWSRWIDRCCVSCDSFSCRDYRCSFLRMISRSSRGSRSIMTVWGCRCTRSSRDRCSFCMRVFCMCRLSSRNLVDVDMEVYKIWNRFFSFGRDNFKVPFLLKKASRSGDIVVLPAWKKLLWFHYMSTA